MSLVAGCNIPEICWARIYFLLGFFKVLVDSCAETFSGWKWRQCRASLGNFGHLQGLVPSFMTVLEGCVGNEAPVWFALSNKSHQICVPEPVLSGVLGRESHSCWWRRNLWSSVGDIFMPALVSERFAISQRSMPVPRGSPTDSEVMLTGFWQDINQCLCGQIIQLSKWLLWSAWSLLRIRCWNKWSRVESCVCFFPSNVFVLQRLSQSKDFFGRKKSLGTFLWYQKKSTFLCLLCNRTLPQRFWSCLLFLTCSLSFFEINHIFYNKRKASMFECLQWS